MSRAIDAAAAHLGWPEVEVTRLGGGCIHPAARLSHGGEDAFLKWSDAADFQVEAAGLRALAERGGLRIPEVLGVGEGWLLLEFLDAVRPSPDDHVALGRGLAELHRRVDAPPGFELDGWIGSLPQDNGVRRTWGTFWAEARLRPRLEGARPHLSPAARDAVERAIERTPELLDGIDEMSLLHGDLWNGNHLFTADGPALIDPAVYRGHSEVDLAMMALFGGFRAQVVEAYDAVRPPEPGRRERRALYQLYPLLVHVELFGEGYATRTEAAARSVA